MERLNIVVVGPGASGKDFFRKNLLSLGYKPSISYTTRPPREGEEDSIDYHFVCKEDFVNMIGDSFFYEWNYFAKSWYYGTPKSAFDGRYNLFIMTPSGVSALSEEHRAKSIVVYINPEENVRKTRLLARRDADLADRRLETDRVDFCDFRDFDIEVNDAEFSVESILGRIKILEDEQKCLTS